MCVILIWLILWHRIKDWLISSFAKELRIDRMRGFVQTRIRREGHDAGHTLRCVPITPGCPLFEIVVRRGCIDAREQVGNRERG